MSLAKKQKKYVSFYHARHTRLEISLCSMLMTISICLYIYILTPKQATRHARLGLSLCSKPKKKDMCLQFTIHGIHGFGLVYVLCLCLSLSIYIFMYQLQNRVHGTHGLGLVYVLSKKTKQVCVILPCTAYTAWVQSVSYAYVYLYLYVYLCTNSKIGYTARTA